MSQRASDEPFRRAIFRRGPVVGLTWGCPVCDRLPTRYVTARHSFALDAPQLLKHLLGLGEKSRTMDASVNHADPATVPQNSWRLVLLWYEAPVPASMRMRIEIDRFTRLLGSDAAHFEARTYQQLWLALVSHLTAEHSGYREYVGLRYFPPLDRLS